MSGSKREEQVLERAARGQTDVQIASELGVSVHTVDQYGRRIRARLGTASRTEAVARAIREGASAENQRLLFEIVERERAEANLCDLNAVLERRVEERTRELSDRIRGFYRELQNSRDRAKRNEERVEMLEACGTVLFQADTAPPFRGLFVTENFEQFGWTAQEFLDGRVIITDFIHADDLPEVESMVDDLLKIRPDSMTCVLRLRTRGGETRFVYEQIGYLPDGRRYGGTMVDITETKPERVWQRFKKGGETVMQWEKAL